MVICNDKNSNLEDFLEKDNSISIHYRSNQTLAIEMNKVTNSIFPEIMNKIFHPKGESYNLRYKFEFVIPLIHNVYYGSEFVSYL